MPNNSFLLLSEPDWIVNRPGIRYQIPENAQSWIYEAGSLTQRLREMYGDSFKVEIVFHQWQRPFISERSLLSLKRNQYALIREVILSSGNTPLILARTIIPIQTLKGAQRNLANLGTRPLGEVIFSYPKLQRLEMDVSCIKQECWTGDLKAKVGIADPIWGRRTVYSIMNREMLVNEFFLPELLKNTYS